NGHIRRNRMRDYVLVGRQGNIHQVPTKLWLEHLEHARHHPSERLAFMTAEHHRVRNFAVAELPLNNEKPLKARDIAQKLQLRSDLVETVLDDLEKNLFFLARDPAGDVSWAYPVTAEATPHRLLFDS